MPGTFSFNIHLSRSAESSEDTRPAPLGVTTEQSFIMEDTMVAMRDLRRRKWGGTRVRDMVFRCLRLIFRRNGV